MTFKYAVVGSAKPFIDSEKQYSELKSELNKLGMLEANFENCDYLIFINYNKKFYKKYKKLRKALKNLVLIRLEPVAVLPIQYKKSCIIHSTSCYFCFYFCPYFRMCFVTFTK